MIVETRRTAHGREYWDTELKKTVFVPAGKNPKFEVTADPASMISGVDLASGSDMSVVNAEAFDWDEMNAEQLLEYAKQNDVKVPGNIKKEDTIRKYIVDVLAADAE